MILYFLIILLAVILFFFITGILYTVTKGKVCRAFFHDTLGWHIPAENTEIYDGCNKHAICRICKREIMQDSQGNWF